MSFEAKNSSRTLLTSSSISKVLSWRNQQRDWKRWKSEGQGQGNREHGVRPRSQGLRGFPWSPSLCGVQRCREGGMAGTRRRPSRKLAQLLHHCGQLAAVEVCIDSFFGWEELIMNESAAAPRNTEHELLLEAGRFWSRSFFTSRHTHLVSAPVR